jgi:parallel beta-helix repeat protein
MKNLILGITLFSFIHFVNAQTTSSNCCSNAQVLTTNVGTAITSNQTAIWYSFVATQNSMEFLAEAINTTPPTLTDISIYSGTCSSLSLMETHAYAINTTQAFSSILTVGSTYYVKLSSTGGNATQIKSSVFKQPQFYNYVYFENQYGKKDSCYFDLFNPIYGNSQDGDTIASTPWHNCLPTFCIGDTICISGIFTNDAGTTVNTIFSHILSQSTGGTIVSNSPTEVCMTFTSSGQKPIYLNPFFDWQINNPSSPYSIYNNNTGLWNGDCNYYINLNIVSVAPPGASNTNSNHALCLNEPYVLTAYSGSVLSTVSINNGVVIHPNTSSWTTSFTTPGTYVIHYTETGFCEPATYTDTVIITSDTVIATMIDCHTIQFDLQNCSNATNYQYYINNQLAGNGSINGNYAVISDLTVDFTNAFTWEVQLGVLTFGQFNSQSSFSGSFSATPYQPLTLSAGGTYLCEMKPSTVQITQPSSGLLGINWSSSSTLPYNLSNNDYTLNTNSQWLNYTADVTVSVYATDSNGCKSYGEITLKTCCSPMDANNNEYFEKMLVAYEQIIPALPSGYYNGPELYSNSPVTISFVQPALTSNVSTSYYAPITLSAYSAANPTVVTYDATLDKYTINSINNKWLFFNNDLILDGKLDIINTNFIRFAPNARIILDPTKQLSLFVQRSTIAPRCDQMWGGIVESNEKHLVTIEGSYIIGAKSALKASNKSVFRVNASFFVDNYIGIYNLNSTITDNYIKNSFFLDVPNHNLLAPYANFIQPHIGVKLENVNSIIVGSSLTNERGNLFFKSDFGIFDTISTQNKTPKTYKLFSYKNNFFNITKQIGQGSVAGKEYCAIYGYNKNVTWPSNNTLEFYIGGSTANYNFRNNFYTIETGVSTHYDVKLTVNSNYFRNILRRGINYENSSRTALITANEIIGGSSNQNKNAFGVYLKNFPNKTVSVENNSFNYQSNNVVLGVGVYVSYDKTSMGANQFATIKNNTINNSTYGVWVLNSKKATLSSNTINYYLSDASLANLGANFSLTGGVRGIILQKANSTTVLSNNIKRPNSTAYNAINITNLQGIRIENSLSDTIAENYMLHTAAGIFAKGACNNAKINCNTMENNFNGFYFDNGTISQQGYAPNQFSQYPGGRGADNKWINNLSPFKRKGGTKPTVDDYYHMPGAEKLSNPGVSPAIESRLLDKVLTSPNARSFCPITLPLPIVTTEEHLYNRDLEMKAVLDGAAEYDSLKYEYEHVLALNAYQHLQEDSTLLNLGGTNDTDYQNFVTENANTYIGNLWDFHNFVENQQYDDATTMNSTMESNAFSERIRSVQQIRLHHLMDSLDGYYNEMDSAYLMETAQLDGLLYGAAVYQARAMLDINGEDLREMNFKHLSLNFAQSNKTKIYPNPFNEQFNIESEQLIKTIHIFDLNGKEVYSNSMNDYNQSFAPNLQNGMYQLKLIFENETVENQKLLVY